MFITSISEQTAIMSLSIVKWFLLITAMDFVYCAVRTGSLNRIPIVTNFYFILVFRSQNARTLPGDQATLNLLDALNTKKLSQSELHFCSPCFSSFAMEWGLVLLYLFVTFNYFNHHSSPISFYFHLVAPVNLVNTWVWDHKSLHHAGSGTRSPAGGRGPSGSPESRL